MYATRTEVTCILHEQHINHDNGTCECITTSLHHYINISNCIYIGEISGDPVD